MGKRISDKMADTWRSIKPQAKPNGSANPTTLDASNMVLGGAVAVVLIWICHDLFGIHVPPEVGAAFGTISGYVTARMLRY